ncbi:MAG: type II toxin-antitoxin system RelE/ParE family toxin [Opitutaceae bacterium]|nr:type II toxin-antitoxin system RelE/ParE family toxin [Opitutaceae bacterium]
MSWRVVLRQEVEHDVAEAAAWYEARQRGLGSALVEEVITIWDELAINPLLNSRRDHPEKDIRWRLTNRFPYRVVYEVMESTRTVVVACVVHAARHDRHWRARV